MLLLYLVFAILLPLLMSFQGLLGSTYSSQRANYSLFFRFFIRWWRHNLTQVKILYSDNGGEYMFGAFSSYLTTHGIVYHTTCLHTTEQNGIAQKKKIITFLKLLVLSFFKCGFQKFFGLMHF